MIYIDLDDVTADFIGYVNRALGANYNVGELMTDSDWADLRQDHQQMFIDLEPNAAFTPILSKLIDVVPRGELAFLTALPCDDKSTWPHAPLLKVRWVDNYLTRELQGKADIPVFFGPYAHDKHKHCKIGDILIDDRRSNCDEWEAAGGIAHVYRNSKDCIVFLKDHVEGFK